MKQLLWIVVIAAAIFFYVQLRDTWQGVKKKYPDLDVTAQSAAPTFTPASLPGLPQGLETSLATAEKNGAKALQTWLSKCRPYVQDPRLAWIELDYVIMISQEDLPEARRVFQSVKNRTPPTSPVYARVKKLEKTYQ
jgi:hypothetical protein